MAGQNPTLYAYVSDPNFEIAPFGLAKHRGRIQAQGSKLEESVAWNRDTPSTVSEGLAMVDELEAKLSETDRKLRKTEFEKARKLLKMLEMLIGLMLLFQILIK
ncbi:hypothetical protein [Lysinibacillus sp. G4S2]|uniref:hypothetical protein n=1 Tax=Lysinibacillus sp. G4S2 TaxID=3055859 RepID=UPI00259FF61D|nr:hypothetical protein [Lysinibacillus sp. G4S2]MDM5249142.1 hypothetical protein [Lysinibacillus sp. G4S2]